MNQYQERDGGGKRKPDGKNRIREIGPMESVELKKKEDVLDRTNWKNDIQNHSTDPR